MNKVVGILLVGLVLAIPYHYHFNSLFFNSDENEPSKIKACWSWLPSSLLDNCFGTLNFENGSQYVGAIKAGLPDGKGEFIFPAGYDPNPTDPDACMKKIFGEDYQSKSSKKIIDPIDITIDPFSHNIRAYCEPNIGPVRSVPEFRDGRTASPKTFDYKNGRYMATGIWKEGVYIGNRVQNECSMQVDYYPYGEGQNLWEIKGGSAQVKGRLSRHRAKHPNGNEIVQKGIILEKPVCIYDKINKRYLTKTFSLPDLKEMTVPTFYDDKICSGNIKKSYQEGAKVEILIKEVWPGYNANYARQFAFIIDNVRSDGNWVCK